MRTILRNFTHLSVLSTLSLAALICGASPQEGRTPRLRPQPTQDTISPAPSPSPSPRFGTSGRLPHRGLGQPSESSRRGITHLNFYPGTRLIVPPGWNRCTLMPTFAYWQERDLMAEFQWLSRRGFIPVTPLGDSVQDISDFVQKPAGWRAYGVAVPAGGTLQLEVKHDKLGWFRLMLVNQWGQPGPGMLQAAIAYQPILVTYTNPGKDATAVYVIVDDPAWWSDANDPYTLVVRRDWDPARIDLSKVNMVAGLWGASPSVSAEFRGPSLTGPAVYPR